MPQSTGLRARQKADVRQSLYREALQLFRTEGFEKTSVQRICAQAGVAKGTFFNYFPSKDHVLQAWYRDLTLGALEEARSSTGTTAEQTVLTLFGALIRGVEADADLWDAKAHGTSSTVLRSAESSLDQDLYQFLIDAILLDQREGRLPSSSDAGFLTDMIISVLTGTAHSWTVSEHSFDLTATLSARVTYLFSAAHLGATTP